MAIDTAYATVEDYRARAGKLDSAHDADIEADLDAFSQLINQETSRNFNQSALVARRFYPGLDGSLLDVDDIASVTGLAIVVDADRVGTFSDLTAWTIETDFDLLPSGALERGVPYTKILIPTWSNQSPWSNQSRVQVTAIWGWPAVPSAIKQVCIENTRTWRFEGPRGSNRFSDMGEMITSTREARSLPSRLLDPYRKYPVAVA